MICIYTQHYIILYYIILYYIILYYIIYYGYTDPVYDPCGVEMLDATQHLVEKIGHPLMVQIHLYHLAQVGVHQLHHQVPSNQQTNKHVINTSTNYLDNI